MVSRKAKKALSVAPAAVAASAGVKTVKAAMADAPAQARGLVDELNERLVPALQSAREHLTPVLADARERIGGTVDERVVPALHDAGERLGPVIATARVRAGETAREVGGRLADRAEPYAHEAARRGGNALEALKGNDIAPAKKKKRGGAVRGLFVVGALGGLAYAAWRALAGPKGDPWTDSAGSDGAGSGSGFADTVEKARKAAAGVAGKVQSRVTGDSADDGSPSAEEGAFVSDLGTFAGDDVPAPTTPPEPVVEVVEPVQAVPLDGVTEETEQH